MRHAIRSWSWRLLFLGGLLIAATGASCGNGDCENVDGVDDWFKCVWRDIEGWF